MNLLLLPLPFFFHDISAIIGQRLVNSSKECSPPPFHPTSSQPSRPGRSLSSALPPSTNPPKVSSRWDILLAPIFCYCGTSLWTLPACNDAVEQNPPPPPVIQSQEELWPRPWGNCQTKSTPSACPKHSPQPPSSRTTPYPFTSVADHEQSAESSWRD